MRDYGAKGIRDAIRAAGGEVYAITSEPQSLATNAQQEWDTGFEHVGDPHQEIVEACRSRGWLSLFSHDWGGQVVPSAWVSHPKGFLQPGVLALSREGRVLYRWRCRPTRQNVGGAVARPTEEHVWERVQHALAEPADAPDVPHDDDPVLSDGPVPWPLFVTLLLANGWFLKPVAFDQRPGVDTVRDRQRRAMLRVPLFLLFWGVLFWLLPSWLAVAAFVAWVVFYALPGVRQVHERFQSVGAEEEPA